MYVGMCCVLLLFHVSIDMDVLVCADTVLFVVVLHICAFGLVCAVLC